MIPVLQTILPANENAAIGIYVCLSAVTMVAAILLPIETKGRVLMVSLMPSEPMNFVA